MGIPKTTGGDTRPSGTERTMPGSASIRVVTIDDDPMFVEALSENLKDNGFQVETFTDSVSALDHLVSGGVCDAILLDWYMPRLSGVVFLRRLRDAGVATPVIVLTGGGSDNIEDAALGFGATDFVDKSRRVSILVKRLRLIAEGTKSSSPGVFPDAEETNIGHLSLRGTASRALWRGVEVNLTFTEFRIVQMLATRAGTDLTYRQIYDVVHGEGFCAGDGEAGYRVNVRSLIKRIRQKFHSIDPGFDEIENYPGFGYRWHARAAVEASSSATTDRDTESLGNPTMKRADAQCAGQITA